MDVTDGSEQRLAELVDRMQVHHYDHGLSICMEKWICVKKQYYDTVLDGELVGVSQFEYMDFYPQGTFECGRCNQTKVINERQYAYFHYYNNYMICHDCNQHLKHNITPPYPSMWCRVIGHYEMSSRDDIVILSRYPNLSQSRRHYRVALARSKKIADRSGKHFFDGMCTLDLWHRMLAQRVVRRLRALVAKRTQEKVAYIIYHCTHVNKDTAMAIAASAWE